MGADVPSFTKSFLSSFIDTKLSDYSLRLEALLMLSSVIFWQSREDEEFDFITGELIKLCYLAKVTSLIFFL